MLGSVSCMYRWRSPYRFHSHSADARASSADRNGGGSIPGRCSASSRLPSSSRNRDWTSIAIASHGFSSLRILGVCRLAISRGVSSAYRIRSSGPSVAMSGQLEPSHVPWLPRWLMATPRSRPTVAALICWFFGTRILVPDLVLAIASFVTCTQYDFPDLRSCSTRICGMECLIQ